MLIQFPSDALITRSDLGLRHTGQVALRSIYGAGTQVLGRGPGYWAGRLEIAPTDRFTDATRRAVEMFLSRLRGVLNTFEVPIHRPSSGTLAAGTALTVSVATMIASGALEITVMGAARRLVVGDYVRIGGRLYQLATDMVASKFTVEPPAMPPTGSAVLWENVTCRARLAESREGGLVSSWTPDFGGPWVIDWEEAI